jgi:hypothetical protein
MGLEPDGLPSPSPSHDPAGESGLALAFALEIRTQEEHSNNELARESGFGVIRPASSEFVSG